MYLGIDIGGTKTLLGLFDEDANIVATHKFPTSPEHESFIADLREALQELPTQDFTHAAIGIRGNIDRDHGMYLYDTILPWRNTPIQADIQAVIGCPVLLENDSKAAGVGEAMAVIDQFRKTLYVTISTGIGSCYLVDGQIDTNMQDSEVGKTLYPQPDGYLEWEQFASGKAMVERYGQRADEIEDPELWRKVTEPWAMGLINAGLTLTPDVIILGGGAGAQYDRFATYLNENIQRMLPEGMDLIMPPIQGAKHPEEAVIYGCYHLAKRAANASAA